jgi:hypothetical protein
MTPTRGWIQDTLMRIQNAFLDAPTLTLTPAEAARRFGLERVAGEAFLSALADAGVLIKGPDGAYARLIPRSGFSFAGGSALESRHRNRAA